MNQLSDYIKEYIAFTKDECDLIIEFYEENESEWVWKLLKDAYE